MRYFSTFTGIGGFEVGIRNAFEATRLLQGVDHRDSEAIDGGGISAEPLCIGYSEIDRFAASVYQRHFQGVKNYGDITKINAEELPAFDCLVGGFPCQAFSVAGKRRGFDDTRGTLFFELARILKEKQPRLFVFENVKGLLSHDQGRTFITIIAAIDELGYDCQWQVLNSKNHGVPQNRERVIIVGHLRGTPRPEVFPIAGSNQADFVVPTVTARYASAQTVGGYIGEKPPQDSTASGQAAHEGWHKSDAASIDRGQGDAYHLRRLTPLECERLQGFPDNWTKYGEDEKGLRVNISDSQRYKMCGNAVTTNVIQAVFERILE